MARLWKHTKESPEGKFLVLRRDGSVPEWPYFVLGARDPAAPAALFAYAEKADELVFDSEYVEDIHQLALEFIAYLDEHGPGDPTAPRHRGDDPAIVAKMAKAKAT